jgi:hypothetical protein
MKYLKLFLIIAAILFLPVTIFATQNTDCSEGSTKNSLGICEGRKSSGLPSNAPQNGKLNSSKDDFECDRGYVKNFQNWSCDEIKLPENGVLTFAGNDWTCIANYKRVGDKCAKVELPENAKFFIHGSDWYCNSGFEKIGDKCTKLEVPANAHQTYSGNDWECNKGFKESADQKSCEEVKIPNDAQSNYIGSFNCNSGFKKVGDKCEKQPSIENGTFYTEGADFYCAKGFKKNESERKCDKIKIPDNAHPDDLSLDGWTCNGEYEREGDSCRKFTLPEHGYWFNNNWGCELGYRKNPTNESCDKVNLPENAKYVNTYDGWECNNGYTKNYRENRCDKT